MRQTLCDQCGKNLGPRPQVHVDVIGPLSGYGKDFCDEFCLLKWTINRTAQLVDSGVRPVGNDAVIEGRA